MGGRIEKISKSSNINDTMESKLLDIMNNAVEGHHKDYCDFITAEKRFFPVFELP